VGGNTDRPVLTKQALLKELKYERAGKKLAHRALSALLSLPVFLSFCPTKLFSLTSLSVCVFDSALAAYQTLSLAALFRTGYGGKGEGEGGSARLPPPPITVQRSVQHKREGDRLLPDLASPRNNVQSYTTLTGDRGKRRSWRTGATTFGITTLDTTTFSILSCLLATLSVNAFQHLA
jgi:hypothetical protein